MFEFFAILAILSLIGFAIFITMAALGKEPLGFWLIALVVSGFLLMCGLVGGWACADIKATKEYEIEVQHPSMNEGYNYCPYCGKEIEK